MSGLLVSERELRQRSLAVMITPRCWLFWPFLPLRRAGPGGAIELGVLYDARGASGRYGHSSTVFLTCIFELPATEAAFLALPRHVYDTADELLDAGWRVD